MCHPCMLTSHPMTYQNKCSCRMGPMDQHMGKSGSRGNVLTNESPSLNVMSCRVSSMKETLQPFIPLFITNANEQATINRQRRHTFTPSKRIISLDSTADPMAQKLGECLTPQSACGLKKILCLTLRPQTILKMKKKYLRIYTQNIHGLRAYEVKIE